MPLVSNRGSSATEPPAACASLSSSVEFTAGLRAVRPGQPGIDQHPRNRDLARQLQIGGGSAGHTVAVGEARGVPDLLDAEPAHLDHLSRLGNRFRGAAAFRARLVPQHQRSGKWPRLRCHVARGVCVDSRLLAHLALDRLLGRLSRRNVSGEDREATVCPADAAAEEDVAIAVVHQHDHHRVGARKVGLAAARAAARQPGLGYARAGTAVGTEPVLAVPVEQGDEICREATLGLRKQEPRLPQRCEPPSAGLPDLALGLGIVEVSAEQRVAVVESQQDRLVRIDVSLDRPAQQTWLWRVGDQHAVRTRSKHRGTRMLQQPLDLSPVSAQLAGAIDRGARERRCQRAR